MVKFVIGGSPCTYWSIAQKNNRETEASGIGWELFKNYLIAVEKFKPDYFLYENNKSISKDIKAQITQELGVNPICINSALVSAQNRQREYWTNIPNVTQPEDRGILLRDILQSGVIDKEKAYCLTSSYNGAVPFNTFERKQRTMIAEATSVRLRGREVNGEVIGKYEARTDGKNGVVTANTVGINVAVPVPVPQSAKTKEQTIYEVKNGIITIKDKQYPIKLADGFYIIRKLTPIECERLQTLPDNYTGKSGVSDTQRYKGLGNGWTAEVIMHILRAANIPLDEEIEVLSMYDGIGTGRYCFDVLGYKNVKYYAYEIDKYPIQIAMSNYPDIHQFGDAFALREDKTQAWENV